MVSPSRQPCAACAPTCGAWDWPAKLVTVLPHVPAAIDALQVLRADRDAAPVVLEHLAGELLAA